MDANNVTSDTFSLVLIPHRENFNAIFASEKLENSNNLIKSVTSFKNMTINDVGYELNTVTASDAEVKFTSDPDRITRTNNGITHQNILSRQMFRI